MKNILLTITLLFVSTLAQAQTWQQLDSLGQALTKQQKFKEADSILQIALKKVEAQHGKDTSYAKVARSLGVVCYYTGQFKRVEPLWVDVVKIYAEQLGKKNIAYVHACSNLAIFYSDNDIFDKSEALFKESISALENIAGRKNLDYATISSGLASLYWRRGLYEKAEPLYLEAKEIREKVVGKEHPHYSLSCNNLAVIYVEQGFYDKGELLYLETLKIQEKTLGKKHIEYARTISNLSGLYLAQGLYDKAEPLLQVGRNIRAEVLGKKHPDYAQACHNLAVFYVNKKLYEKAQGFYLEAIQIKDSVFGKNNPEYAMSCSNLGSLYYDMKLYEKAEKILEEVKTIQKKTLGTKNRFYSITCQNLGNIYTRQKKYDLAEQYYKEAMTIQASLFGEKHDSYMDSYHGLGNVYFLQDIMDSAAQIYFDVTLYKQEQINLFFPIFSEEEKQAYWRSIRYCFESFTQFCNSYGNQKPVIMADLYDQTLFTKGIIFSSTQKIKNTILNSGDTVLVNQYNNWKKQRETYTKLYQLPLEEQKKQNLDLEGMKNQINDLEKDLSKKSALFGQNVQTKSYKWQEVKAKLAKNEVVIEIIKSDSAYIALFLTAQTENYPAFYLFKNAQELEDKFLNYYKNCIEFKIEDTVSYNAFWKPIADKLSTLNKKGFKKIYFSPDGVFHQLSLNTLKNTKTGKFLLEEANIQLIGSSRDLIELNKKSRDLSQNYENYQAHLLGYPIYGAENTEKEPEKKRDRSLGFSGMQSAVGVAGAVSLLPGTKKEVENVFGLFNQKKLKVNLLLAENATEEALKNLKSPTILHVATHGFFIPEIKDSEVQDMQTAMNRNLLKNPFMRSGLLLAGCQKPNPDKEDGILTAEEVMNLTLDNTELVVMSACETGLGDIQAGEGVFGLQRAFQQAGAKSVLMSLWKVDDEATQTLMTEFYTALLKGQSKRQAFKTAQMNLKKRFPEPYYWGAFVMVGE